MFNKLITSANFLFCTILFSDHYLVKDFKSRVIGNNVGKVLLFLYVFILSSSAFPQWARTNGPEGVAISSLASIDGTIYAGTEVNGMYASTDDGVNWTARNAGIETLDVRSIVSKPGYIFAGTFGHCTSKGNRLLAENIAHVILQKKASQAR